MEYNKVKAAFDIYVDSCKEKIINNESMLTEDVKKERLNMINTKIDHTMRMVDEIIKINEQLNIKIDFKLVIQIAVLYHDIGRFSQATWSSTFSDGASYKAPNDKFHNHGEEGQYVFFNNNFDVDTQFIPIIGESILYHNNQNLPEHLQYKYTSDISKININDIVTGKFILNEAECHIASLITQLVADIDKIDILYQYLTPDCTFIKNYIVEDSQDTLDNISLKWGISKNEIIEFNQNNHHYPKIIRIPIENVELSKLEIPKYMKEMFYNNSWKSLQELQQDPNWNFITVMWWRLSEFLNQINFHSILVNTEEAKLISRLKQVMPEKIKPLLEEAFEYADEVLIKKAIKTKKEGIYLKKGAR